MGGTQACTHQAEVSTNNLYDAENACNKFDKCVGVTKDNNGYNLRNKSVAGHAWSASIRSIAGKSSASKFEHVRAFVSDFIMTLDGGKQSESTTG